MTRAPNDRCPRCEKDRAANTSHFCEPPPARMHLFKPGSLGLSLCGLTYYESKVTKIAAQVTCRLCLRSMGSPVAGVA